MSDSFEDELARYLDARREIEAAAVEAQRRDSVRTPPTAKRQRPPARPKITEAERRAAWQTYRARVARAVERLDAASSPGRGVRFDLVLVVSAWNAFLFGVLPEVVAGPENVKAVLHDPTRREGRALTDEARRILTEWGVEVSPRRIRRPNGPDDTGNGERLEGGNGLEG